MLSCVPLLVCRLGEIRRMAFARNLLEADAFRPFFWSARSASRPCGLMAALVAALVIAGCSNTMNTGDLSAAAPAAPVAAPDAALGTGGYKVALVLPLSATGNAGGVALTMRNAA